MKWLTFGVDGAKDKTKQHQAACWARATIFGRPIIGVLGARNLLRSKALDYYQMITHLFNGDDYTYGLDIKRLLEIKVHKDGVDDGEVEPKDLLASYYEDLVEKYIKLYPNAFKYDYKFFVKQCSQMLTDGAANMYGAHSGLQVLVDNDQCKYLKLPQAFKDSTQCWDHKMELGKLWKRDERSRKKKELKKKERKLRKKLKLDRKNNSESRPQVNKSNDNSNANSNDNNNNNIESKEEAKGDDENEESDSDGSESNIFNQGDEMLLENAASKDANLLGNESARLAMRGGIDVDGPEDDRKEYLNIKDKLRELEKMAPPPKLFGELEDRIQFVFKTFNTVSLQVQLRAECIKMGIKYQEINPMFDIRWIKHLHITFTRAANMAQSMLYTLINVLDATRKRLARTGQSFDFPSTRVWKTLQKLMEYFFIIKDRQEVVGRIAEFSMWCERYDHYIFDIMREYYYLTSHFELRSTLCYHR